MIFNKTKIIKFISKELKNSIPYFHILSVVTIFIEELAKEIIANRIIKIPNFGTFKINSLKPKMITNVLTKAKQQTKPSNVLRFTLTKKLGTYLKGMA